MERHRRLLQRRADAPRISCIAGSTVPAPHPAEPTSSFLLLPPHDRRMLLAWVFTHAPAARARAREGGRGIAAYATALVFGAMAKTNLDDGGGEKGAGRRSFDSDLTILLDLVGNYFIQLKEIVTSPGPDQNEQGKPNAHSMDKDDHRDLHGDDKALHIVELDGTTVPRSGAAKLGQRLRLHGPRPPRWLVARDNKSSQGRDFVTALYSNSNPWTASTRTKTSDASSSLPCTWSFPALPSLP